MTDQRDTFNAIARDYHALRPPYPDELFGDLASVVSPDTRVLEVGCGSGQATRGLLDRGWQVVAVDPGPELVSLAEASLTGPVTFHVQRFETFVPEPSSFGLVASAQAWHWIDPAVAFPKAAAALRTDGWLAVFGHVPMTPPPEVLTRLEPIYSQLAPELWCPPPQAWYLPEGPVRQLFDASGLFGAVHHKGYAWSELVMPHAFVGQLRTRSDYNQIGPDRRELLLGEVESALRPLGELSLSNETHLYFAPLAS